MIKWSRNNALDIRFERMDTGRSCIVTNFNFGIVQGILCELYFDQQKMIFIRERVVMRNDFQNMTDNSIESLR